MMGSYTDVFGSQTVPPAEQGYSAIALTANTTLQWPEFFSGTGNVATAIMDVTPTAAYDLTMPEANKVSIGRDLLVKNPGAFTITLKDSAGGVLGSVTAGSAVYLYLKTNSTAAGTWGVIAFGVGSSSVDAATLVGYGIKAIGATLNQSHPTSVTSGNIAIDATYRAKAVIGTDTGATTVSLTSVATLGDDFFFFYRNSGAGTATIDPAGAELIDGQATLTVQPGESLMCITSGAAWYSVGLGRSLLYQFTQLTYDVSGGGPFTLTASEAANKLISFTGNPAADVTVNVPQTVSVYYLDNALATAHSVTFKTAVGTGITVGQTQRTIAICDGTSIVSAVSIVASTSVSLISGTVSAPSLNFAASTNTGLYLNGASGLGIAVAGVAALLFDNSGDISTAKNINVNSGKFIVTASSGATTIGGALTYGGVTLTNAVTGTGKMVLDTSPTIVTPVINSVAHVGGAWVADATWTLPAFVLGGAVTSPTNQSINIGTGALTAGAISGTTGTFTKATVGDVLTVTNGGANPLPVYTYSGNNLSGIATGAALTGQGIYFDATSTHILANGHEAVMSSTGLSLGSNALTAGAISGTTFTGTSATNGSYISLVRKGGGLYADLGWNDSNTEFAFANESGSGIFTFKYNGNLGTGTEVARITSGGLSGALGQSPGTPAAATVTTLSASGVITANGATAYSNGFAARYNANSTRTLAIGSSNEGSGTGTGSGIGFYNGASLRGYVDSYYNGSAWVSGWGLTAGTDVITISSAGVTIPGTLSFGGAGTARATGGLRIVSDSTNNLLYDSANGAGSATLYIGNASINVTSDENLKSNIRPLADGLNIIRALTPIEYDQDEERPWGDVRHYVGFGARASYKVAPWTVNTQGDTGLPWKMRQEFLMAPVVKSIQQIDSLQQNHESRLSRIEHQLGLPQ